MTNNAEKVKQERELLARIGRLSRLRALVFDRLTEKIEREKTALAVLDENTKGEA